MPEARTDNTADECHSAKPRRKPWRRRLLLLGCVLAFAGGCRATYYGQAIQGQWHLLAYRQPIARVLASPQTDAELKEKLLLVGRLCDFAQHQLKLPAQGQYVSFVDVGRKHVLWNVYAAPEFSIEAKTWWYPVVGRLKYRGYFAETDALRCAAKLRQKGWDTYVGGVDAYSTLGWFKEPVLSTFIREPEPELAGIIFHELAHEKLFAGGDTDFNEAFATVVEQEGVRRWLATNGATEALRRFEQELLANDEFQKLLEQARQKLREIYEAPLPANPGQDSIEARRKAKAATFDWLRAECARLDKTVGGGSRFGRWASNQLNNAKLASEDAYHRFVPALRALMAQNRNDMEAFYSECKRLAKMPKARRHAALEKLKSPQPLS